MDRTTVRARRNRANALLFHVPMSLVSILWLMPIVFVILVSIRTFPDIMNNGLTAWPASFSLEGYATVFDVAGGALVNSVTVTLFTVFFSLLLASWAAYALSRNALPFRVPILLLMLAGNLLPPQILLIPIARISESLGVADTLLALIVIQIAFGLGFYTFVLHGFMRAIPAEIFEAARIDGAGDLRIYMQIVLPLCRPSLAALAALATTWIWNDLIWALTVLRTETKFPITPQLLNIQGGFVSQWNVVAAGALTAALPTAIVFFLFQRHFVSGLTLGAGK